MKRLLCFSLMIWMLVPIQPAQALGCAQVKTMIKSLGVKSNLGDVKGASSMVNAYKTAFENPKCISSMELTEMKKAAKDLIVECAKPDTLYKGIMSKPIFTAFCGGFKKLQKYTK